MSTDDRSIIPIRVAQACGVFAGTNVGMKAGHVISHEIVQQLPGALQPHADLLDQVFVAAGGFGCAMAGYAMATRRPAQAVLIAAASVVSQAGSQLAHAAVPPPDVHHSSSPHNPYHVSSDSPHDFSSTPADALDVTDDGLPDDIVGMG